jgi:hypothetical protein
MAKFFDSLTNDQKNFIRRQKIFFTATAPQQGRVNLSPKGMDTLRILDGNTVAYLDLTGSGNETAAHISENGRLTIMMCAFEGAPLILRLYGRGEVILPQDPQWTAYMKHFEPIPGMRQIIRLDVESVQTSCGFGVPLFDYTGERDTLVDWAAKKGPEGIFKYHQEKNQRSIDGTEIPIEYQS